MSRIAQGLLAIVAALLVLLSANWQPPAVTVVAAAVLFVVGVYQLARARRS